MTINSVSDQALKTTDSVTFLNLTVPRDINSTGNSLLRDGGFNTNTYNTGTITQSGTTVTGSGTTFTSAMVNGIIEPLDGSFAFLPMLITAFTNGTTITVSSSRTMATPATYQIKHGGLSISSNLIGINNSTTVYGSPTWNGSQLMSFSQARFPTTNVRVGSNTGNAITSGLNNTLLGNGSGLSLTSGDFNLLAGESAGSGLTSGSGAVLLGYTAGAAFTTQSGAVAVGREALSVSTDPTSMAVGYQAGKNSVGSNCTYVGYQAGLGAGGATSDTSNCAFGYQSLASYTTASGQNNAFGYQALNKVTTGDQNNSVGYQSGFNITTGSQNCGLGDAAIFSVTTGSQNSGFGNSAGYSVTTGSFNTCIGRGADVSSGTASNRTSIGNNAVADTDNQMMLGNSSLTQIVSGSTAGGCSLGSTTNPYGVIYLSAGTVSAPSHTFGADTNTGMYNSAANVLGFAANGANSLLLNDVTSVRGAFIGNPLIETDATPTNYTATGTIAAADIVTGLIKASPAASMTLTFDTAANIYAAMGSPTNVGATTRFMIVPKSGVTTIAAGTGITLDTGRTTLAPSSGAQSYYITVTNTGTPTITVFGG